jgi:hypothetical protein
MPTQLREIYDNIRDINIPRKEWEGMAMVGILADATLHFLNGAIIEIGMGESSIYLNRIGEKYNRQVFHCDIQGNTYEEGKTIPGFFREDKNMCIFYCGKSDDFFKNMQLPEISFAFIDGDHSYAQVERDFFNVEKILQTNGIILLHDTMPPHEDYLGENLCGSSWIFRQELEKDNRFDVFTFAASVAHGVGLTVCRKKGINLPFYQL